jgi:tetratricopeptide (TPR) repeat protein
MAQTSGKHTAGETTSTAGHFKLWRAALIGVLAIFGMVIAALLIVYLRLEVFKAAIVVLAVAFFPLTYLAFEVRSETHKERLISGLALLGFGTEERARLETLYRQIYSPQQFVLFVLLAAFSTLLGFGFLYFSQGAKLPLGGLFDQVIARTMFYSFLGAYVFSIYNVTRRFVTFDLQPGVYLNVTVLIITVEIIGFIIALGLREIELPLVLPGSSEQVVKYERWIPIIAFLIGYIPEAGIRWLSTIGSRIIRFGRRQELLLSHINGISIWHETRLRESGIDNVQNLAAADIRKLLLTSRFSAAQVMNWVDQAVLLVNLPLKIVEQLRSRGVTAMSTLVNVIRQPDQTLRPAVKVDNLPAGDLPSIYNAVMVSADTSPNLPYVMAFWEAVKKYDTRQVEAGLQTSLSSQSETWARLDFSDAREVEQLRELMKLLGLSPQELERFFPDTIESLVGLSNVYSSIGSTEYFLEAERVVTQALELDDQYAPAYASRGFTYYRQGRTEEAVKDFQRALELAPDYAPTYQTLGVLYLSQKNFDEAIKVLNGAIAIDPTLPGVYLNRGLVYRNLNEREKAEADLLRAVELASAKGGEQVQVDAYFELGQIYLETTNVNKAIDAFNRVLRLNRDNPLAYLRSGQANLAARRFQWSTFYLVSAIELYEADPHTRRDPLLAMAYSDLSQAYYGLDEPLEALNSAERALSLGDQRPINFKVKGLCHLKLKDREKALENLKIYLLKAPAAADSETIQGAITRLENPTEAKA